MTEYPEDFREIAHCGGQATFCVQCDSNGQKGVAIGFRHSSPGPAAWVGIYAMAPQGIPVADFRMGGIGAPFDPPPPEGCFPVFLGSDSQMRWGHQCPACQSYFRNGAHSSLYPLTCPYCGTKAAAYQFLTEAQRRYVQHYITTFLEAFEVDLEPNSETEIIIDMDSVADAEQGEQPAFYYSSETQQTRYDCDACGDFNDIRGVYGYCASCGSRNNVQTLKNSFEHLRKKLNDGKEAPSEIVRSSVSKFDACCRNIVSQLLKRTPMNPSRKAKFERLVFHDIKHSTIGDLKSAFDVDLLRGVAGKDLKFVKLMMERRHVYEHNDGVVDDRYIRESGDNGCREGDLLRENQGNAHRLLNLLTRIAVNIQEDFHQIFTLTERPVKYHQERQARAKG